MAARYEITDMVFRNVGGGAVLAHSGASVAVKDLQGNNLTVYQAETGSSTFTNPLTSDSNGQIEGFVEAPDYDLSVSGAGISSYTQKVRTSPPGVFNVMSYGAKGDDSTNDRAAFAAADAAAAAYGGGDVVYPAKTFRVGSATPVSTGVNHLGQGWATLIRCTGNHFAFNLNPGQRSRISGFRFNAVSAQSSGGVVDFTNALFNVYIDHVYIDSNIHTAFNVKPAQQGGLYHFDHIRFNGGASMNTGFALGDGTNLITDIHMNDVIGTASTDSDMTNAWVDADNNVDSLNMVDCLFFNGTVGVILGTAGGGGACTNTKMTNVVVDNMSSYGFKLDDCSRLDATACAVQSSGSAANAGVNIGGNCVSVTILGGIVQSCVGTGIAIQSGSLDTTIDGVTVGNNNTSDTASTYGIQASAGATDWAVLNCRSGNNLFGATAGHQKRGLGINTGASDRFRVIGNDFTDNETSGLLNNATGTDFVVRDNLGVGIATVASAATLTVAGRRVVKVSGSTTVTSITACSPETVVTLIWDTGATFDVTDGSNLKLASSITAHDADDTLTLVCDGTNWHEVCRSVN